MPGHGGARPQTVRNKAPLSAHSAASPPETPALSFILRGFTRVKPDIFHEYHVAVCQPAGTFMRILTGNIAREQRIDQAVERASATGASEYFSLNSPLGRPRCAMMMTLCHRSQAPSASAMIVRRYGHRSRCFPIIFNGTLKSENGTDVAAPQPLVEQLLQILHGHYFSIRSGVYCLKKARVCFPHTPPAVEVTRYLQVYFIRTYCVRCMTTIVVPLK